MTLRTQGVSALACLLATACLVSPDANEAGELGILDQPLDTQGFFPGRGYYANADAVAGDCVVAKDYDINTNLPAIVPEQAKNTGGQEVVFSLSKVETAQEIQDKLNISASAAAKFLVAGGSAKFSFAEETKTSDTTVTLVASLVVKNNAWTVPPNVRLHPEARDLLITGQAARFRERCGDGFLHSYTTGGEFFAVIQVQTSSREEKKAISSSIQGNYLTISGSADFSSKMQKIVKNSSTTVKSYQLGGSDADTAPCFDVACVAARISKFTEAVAAKPVVFDAEVLPYEILELPADAVSTLDVTVALDTLKDINRQRNASRDLLTRFLNVQSRPERYALGSPNATLAQVTDAISTINGNLTKLDDALKACARDPNTCKLPSVTAVSVVAPPAAAAALGLSLIRSYDAPSEFLSAGLIPELGIFGAGCKNELAQTVNSLSQAALPPISFVVGLTPSVTTTDATFSLQPASNPNQFFAANNGWSTCGAALRMLPSPLTGTHLEEGTFYVVPGLNGKPNTSSLRLYQSLATPTGSRDPRNFKPNVYVLRKAANDVVLSTIADSADVTLKNAASWYIETP
jgi:hypothetical protein